MLRILAILTLICSLMSGIAGATATSLTSTMHEMGEIMIRLVPWTYQDNKEIPDQLASDVERLYALFTQSSSHFIDYPVGIQLSHDLLAQQLQDLSAGARIYGANSLRILLSESFALCMSCHSQDEIEKKPFSETQLEKLEPGFARAEFMFLTRDYDGALPHYLDYLNTTATSPPDANRLTALERVLVLVTRPGVSPALAINILTELAEDTVTEFESRLIGDWQMAMGLVAKGIMSPVDRGNPSIEELASFIEVKMPRISSDTSWQVQQVFWVILRNNLYRFINQHKQTVEMPRLLYWLASSDRTLQYKFYTGLSRLYLLECITHYSDHPYARQCFDEYELLMIVSFSGSAGSTIPEEVQQELDKLRVFVYQQ
jgi:hypothetical protein